MSIDDKETAYYQIFEAVTESPVVWGNRTRSSVVKELQRLIEAIYWALPSDIPDEFFRAAVESPDSPWAG